MLPPREELTICFAHAAYQMQACFSALATGIRHFELRSREELDRRIGEADVLVVSGLWHNGLIETGKKLRFIQSISAGTDQYDKPALAAAGIRLASAQGANARRAQAPRNRPIGHVAVDQRGERRGLALRQAVRGSRQSDAGVSADAIVGGSLTPRRPGCQQRR